MVPNADGADFTANSPVLEMPWKHDVVHPLTRERQRQEIALGIDMENDGVQDFRRLARDGSTRRCKPHEGFHYRQKMERELVLVWGELELTSTDAGRQ
jgi:hypothetical protein